MGGIVGITHVAHRALGEVVFCRLPRVGERFKTMDTLVTLEAVKSVGEVKCPVFGEVIEVNPRLEREPALVSHSPLTEGWLVRLAFNNEVPRYLQRSRAIPKVDIEHLLADVPAFEAYVNDFLVPDDMSSDADASHLLRELTFDGLYARERYWVHQVVVSMGLYSLSRGSGPGRQVVVRRNLPRRRNQNKDGDAEAGDQDDDDGHEDAKGGEQGRGSSEPLGSPRNQRSVAHEGRGW